MSECLQEDELAAYVAGNATAETDARIKQHIDTCAECRRVFVALVFGPQSQQPTQREAIESTRESPAHGAFDVGATILGKYRIERLLGEGGMGRVLLAHDQALDRRVAIKVMRDEIAFDAKARARFEREARTIARLSNEHAVRIYDFGVLGPLPFIVMEYIDGIDLRAYLKEHGPFSARVAAKHVRAACAALAEAHRAGIVHRDVKPQNLLLSRNVPPTLKLVDFGIAKVTSDAAPLSRTGAVIGTAPFMAPEQIGGDGVDPRTDVWALGATLHYLVTGHAPFEADTRAELTAQIVSKPTPHLGDAALDAILARCLAKKPDDRFRNAEELGDALDRMGADRRPARIWIVAAAAAFVVGATIISFRLSSKDQGTTNAIAPSASIAPASAQAPATSFAVVASTSPSAAPVHSSAPAGKTHCACVSDSGALCKPELMETRCECHDSFGSVLFSKAEDIGARVTPTFSGTDGASCSGFAAVQRKGETVFHAEAATGTLHPCSRTCTSARAFAGREHDACTGVDENGRALAGTLRCEKN